MLVRDVMTTDVVTVSPDAGLKLAIELLDAHEVTSLPVVDDQGVLVGVLSEADVIRDAVLPDRRAHEVPPSPDRDVVHRTVADVMTAHPLSATPDADLAAAAALLVDTQVKSLPVVEQGTVVGMVSRRDVIAVLARRDPLIEAEVDELLRSADVECVVEVEDGVVRLDGPTDQHVREIARVLAGTVPGVVDVTFGR